MTKNSEMVIILSFFKSNFQIFLDDTVRYIVYEHLEILFYIYVNILFGHFCMVTYLKRIQEYISNINDPPFPPYSQVSLYGLVVIVCYHCIDCIFKPHSLGYKSLNLWRSNCGTENMFTFILKRIGLTN